MADGVPDERRNWSRRRFFQLMWADVVPGPEAIQPAHDFFPPLVDAILSVRLVWRHKAPTAFGSAGLQVN